MLGLWEGRLSRAQSEQTGGPLEVLEQLVVALLLCAINLFLNIDDTWV